MPDYFSAGSRDYARYRPDYPARLFAYLAGLAPGRRRAWDCATGSGQAAAGLARHFEEVVATDASGEQIRCARRRRGVRYRVAAAEESGLESGSVELVTVAQAVHWFDRPRFWREARRVLVARGVLAIWCYDLLRVTEEVDAAVRRLYGLVRPFWPAERAIVERGYGSLEFPFERVAAPPFRMEKRWSLSHLLGYLRTWTAVRLYAEARGEDPVERAREDLSRAWGDPDRLRRVFWNLDLMVGRTT
ncbi:MAG: class I SAM-dependent methyltransferase [Thermoanaerobaculia bacterium]